MDCPYCSLTTSDPRVVVHDDEFSPDGYNVGWNSGRVGGQEVFHAHLHVIRRFKQEPLAGQGIRSHLKSDANSW
jgi:histidine triad (HIT) family protein